MAGTWLQANTEVHACAHAHTHTHTQDMRTCYATGTQLAVRCRTHAGRLGGAGDPGGAGGAPEEVWQAQEMSGANMFP